jgi:glycosyltransferase involved in cell wall biosynthesis
MRLLCVIDNLGSGGAQRQLVALGVDLRRRGHTVAFFVYQPQNFFAAPLEQAGIGVARALKRSRWSPAPLLALRKMITSGAHDAVLSFLETPCVYAELARVGRRSPRLVVSERFCDSADGAASPRSVLRQLHRLADAVTTNSHHQRESLEAAHPWMRGRVRTIWNGVDLDRFVPRARALQTTATDELKLLVVSSVSFYKNGLKVIEALDLLRSRSGLRPSLTWIGDHQLHIPSRRAASEAMHREIAARRLADQWRWVEPTPEVGALMVSHDALVHASIGEGLPNVVCEALACGLPVLASRVLDHPRLVQEGLTGLLFDPYDASSLAGAIQRYSEMTRPQRTAMGAAARAFAEMHLSMDRYVSAYEQLLGGIARSPESPEYHRANREPPVTQRTSECRS